MRIRYADINGDIGAMLMKPITKESERKAALKRIDELMGAKAGTPEAGELAVLAILVERYEKIEFPVAPPTVRDAIEFRMEQMGYSQADLARVLGSRSRASEILSGKLKQLSLGMVRRLNEEWHIPADVLIKEAA
jgi:HTH-type transcriptional regulator/antitoxin HigA